MRAGVKFQRLGRQKKTVPSPSCEALTAAASVAGGGSDDAKKGSGGDERASDGVQGVLYRARRAGCMRDLCHDRGGRWRSRRCRGNVKDPRLVLIRTPGPGLGPLHSPRHAPRRSHLRLPALQRRRRPRQRRHRHPLTLPQRPRTGPPPRKAQGLHRVRT